MAIKDERQERPTKLKTSHLCETRPSMPNEIIVEILLKLPVGSLLRVKSVCKLWQSLISDPYFIKSHLSLATSNPHYIHHRLISDYDFSSCRLYDVMFDKPITVVKDQFKHSRHELIRIFSSCNGLLFINHEKNRLVWNPTTGRSSKLVPYHGMPPVYGCYLRYGFGYDESTDDYKVVLIKDAKSVKMYLVKFGNWKDCDDFPTGIHPNYHSDDGKVLLKLENELVKYDSKDNSVSRTDL
ncbi:F-box associated domain containing protein [Tanacetum coccineum]